MICKIPGVNRGGIMTWIKRFAVAVAAAAAAGGLGLTSAASASTAHPATAATPSQTVHQARPTAPSRPSQKFPNREACQAYAAQHPGGFCEKDPGANVHTYTYHHSE
jgi:hypothetical protein